MYEELVKNLRICSRCDFGQDCNGCTQKSDDAFCCDKLLHQAADAIEELKKAVLRLEDESGLYDELPTFYIREVKVDQICPLIEVPAPLAFELYEFAKFVAKEVCREDFEDGAGAFAEIVCRKLNKLGIVEKTDDLWCYNAEDGD